MRRQPQRPNPTTGALALERSWGGLGYRKQSEAVVGGSLNTSALGEPTATPADPEIDPAAPAPKRIRRENAWFGRSWVPALPPRPV
jgi:hypothetical protein